MLAEFVARHIGPGPAEQQQMLSALGYDSLDALLDAAVPASIRSTEPLDLPAPGSEAEVTAALRALAQRNRVGTPMIGLGWSRTHTPGVIRRNVLESPSWYTAYTPYQPEISQGRLEALFSFQTLVSDLTALPIAGASLLDESTAAAEAMTMAARVAGPAAKGGVFVVDADTHPQTLALLAARAEPLGIPLQVLDLADGGAALPEGPLLGVLVSCPSSTGGVRDLRALAEAVHARGGLVAAATDLLALTLLTPPGEWGADVAVGSAQRLGVPLFFGGPHAGFMSVREGLARQLPGRLVGLSRDADGRPAYRLALQTREQHIRRDKATSNICTAQVLLAVVSAMYASYHGPEGLRAIATRTHRHAVELATALRAAGVELAHEHFFDTVTAVVPGRADEVVGKARALGVDLRRVDADRVGVSTDETTTAEHVELVRQAFGVQAAEAREEAAAYPAGLARTSSFLTAPVFTDLRSETDLLRYLRRLSDKDYALDRGMIPLGSCTMKLNATTELEPISWPEFADIHPFQPSEDSAGYAELTADLERWLAEITGYDSVSLQPNAGAQGELAGLLAIRAFHRAEGHGERDVCLVPASAHGTNAASAVLAGLRVSVVATTEQGEIDLDDLRAKLATHEGRVAAIMLTYPSTHGVYEETVGEVCSLVHEAGGQVYVDGANLNALVGVARPGAFGADVSHLNLHKTFCIPHGGGGPGVGPVAVRAHLAPYLPNHPLAAQAGPETGTGPISAAPWGSAGILPIPWAYIRLMGAEGLRRATSVAVLSANYVAARLREHYPVLYTGRDGLVAHECILDLRPLTKATGVTVDDVAKRLIDYGFHAPTMSFPVAGTLMVEPTESEDLREIDRFCDAMVAIRQEADAVAEGRWPAGDNPLARAPHPAESLVDDWDRAYTRREAVYPGGASPEGKYWPPVSRIDSAWGDRNLVCACPPASAFEE
ncbi:glycine dehydrogenase [Motilibacter peucedani]|uniref:Glycine dehydrogenase (decarboxylating) n=1 Tax=Motilibacter peucedani TaxID=598650 RepID=A0A420XSU7_9ACTN|nr:aminomethyl-transferring glycine dehydrogenase [Motilibacter peucedani]RKS77891.1 glycine dehydrogenase [Motilibacter peucedani]